MATICTLSLYQEMSGVTLERETRKSIRRRNMTIQLKEGGRNMKSNIVWNEMVCAEVALVCNHDFRFRSWYKFFLQDTFLETFPNIFFFYSLLYQGPGWTFANALSCCLSRWKKKMILSPSLLIVIKVHVATRFKERKGCWMKQGPKNYQVIWLFCAVNI